MLLNLGYGLVEILGGFLAGSQALKADALDFVGDGGISLLGLMALAWGTAARAKAALLQGSFLGVLGLGVLAMTLWRAFVQQPPEAELMGVFGAVALAVNLAARLRCWSRTAKGMPTCVRSGCSAATTPSATSPWSSRPGWWP